MVKSKMACSTINCMDIIIIGNIFFCDGGEDGVGGRRFFFLLFVQFLIFSKCKILCLL
ncbi:MAG: hypothetical protein ACI90V_008069 [Bacillariaceae sp.]|jgi:hypothetical protein